MEFSEFLQWTGRFIGKPIIGGRIEGTPEGKMEWHPNLLSPIPGRERPDDHDPASVLQHLTEQTGLTFTEEVRTMRVLFLEHEN